MDEKTKHWIKATLSNDETSSDEELLQYFVKEGGLTPEEAGRWVALRDRYLLDLFCDAEPEK
jgi:hypothetical protein